MANPTRERFNFSNTGDYASVAFGGSMDFVNTEAQSTDGQIVTIAGADLAPEPSKMLATSGGPQSIEQINRCIVICSTNMAVHTTLPFSVEFAREDVAGSYAAPAGFGALENGYANDLSSRVHVMDPAFPLDFLTTSDESVDVDDFLWCRITFAPTATSTQIFGVTVLLVPTIKAAASELLRCGIYS